MNTYILSTLAKHNVLDQLYRAPDPIDPDGSNVPPSIRNGLTKLASGAYWVVVILILILVAWFGLKAVASPKNRGANIRNVVAGLVIAVIMGSSGLYINATNDFLDFYFG